MASRGRSAAANAHVDHSYDSSPDPLALSINENKVKAWRKTPQKQPFTAASPGKQNRRLSFSDMELSSPTKSMVMSTPRTANASPWRIKVTVQAEPGSDEENATSPTIKRITKTKTTTVPLKDPDAQSPVKRPRGRPRKSDTGVATKPKRNGTPAKKAARSKSRDAPSVATESSAADGDVDMPPKKRKGRLRKSIQSLDEPTAEIAGLDMTPAPAFTVQPRTSTTKKTADAASYQPESASSHGKEQDEKQPVVPSDKSKNAFLTRHAVPVLDTPPRTELADQLRARKGTPHSRKVTPVDTLTGEDSGEASDVLTPSSGEDDYKGHKINQLSSVPDEEDGEVVADDANAGDLYMQAFEDGEDFESPEFANFAFDEGATRMPDDTTVLDSENFSMISVDSLPSNKSSISPPKFGIPQQTVNSVMESMLHQRNLNLPENTFSETGVGLTGRLSPAPPHKTSNCVTMALSHSTERHKTPVIDAEAPSVPPSINPCQNVASEAGTPQIGRVVTAGVALQGVLDPARMTPQLSQNALNERHNGLDDLFRGFSEGTRKELQSNLHFGEQLAREDSKEHSSFGKSSTIKEQPKSEKKEGVFRTQRKYRQSRLLTPEDQDDYVVTAVPQASESNEIQYPALNTTEIENTLLSPARSEDEMSWRIDTPPVTLTNVRQEINSAPKNPVVADISRHEPQEDDYSDIWQEEASRSSNSVEPADLIAEETRELQELLAGEGPIKPARGKLPRTWRRKSANHFQYSDEAETPQKPIMSSADLIEPVRKRPSEDSPEDEESRNEETESEDGDDTGMFFQSNIPHVYKRTRSTGSYQKKIDKQSLSLLLNEGESLVPESSPPVEAKKFKSTVLINPFLETPRFSGFPSSPKKSSPLRKELYSVDISSDSPRRVEDESTLPLAQSSPFHTFVDGPSHLSTASDQRQFRVEMEGSTASTIRRVRSEANRYLDAYEPQERSLNEIEEVTEPSRTWIQDPSFIASSPPQRKQSFAQSMLSPTRRPVPLFSTHQDLDHVARSRSISVQEETKTEDTQKTSTIDKTRADSALASQTSLFGRVTSTLVGAFNRLAPPPPHSILSKLTPLPRIEPWTKTHYKALDKLYTTHLKHPTTFSPSMVPTSPLSQTNTFLLKDFLSRTKQPYVGAQFSAWGYSMLMTEELVVLCAVYMQLLTLGSIGEYEKIIGKEIQMGDCGPGRPGDAIKGDDVVRRLATVVMGEAVRRDEKLGRSIDKSEALVVEWPQ